MSLKFHFSYWSSGTTAKKNLTILKNDNLTPWYKYCPGKIEPEVGPDKLIVRIDQPETFNISKRTKQNHKRKKHGQEYN